MSRILKLENLTFLGALLGLLCGIFTPAVADNISVVGELFILLLKMIIIPLVFVSVFLAIARQESLQGLSKLGTRTCIYFLTTSSLACLNGLFTAMFLPDISQSNITYESYDPTKLETLSFKQLLLSFFSSNPFKSLSDGDIVQIVVVSLLVGVATLKIEMKKRQTVVHILEAINEIVMVLIRWILLVAPAGVFSLVASVTAATDKTAFAGLGWLFMAIALAMIIHCLVTLPALGYFFGRFNPYRFLIRVKKVLLVALATASSSATLPVSSEVLEEKENVDVKTAGFVLPLGATINMDGSSIYQTLVVLFFANLAGIEVNFTQQIYIFVLILVSSVGTAGVPGGGILMLGAVLQNVGVPLEFLGLYLLVDRFWDPLVTMINVLGDLFGAKIIDRYQKADQT